MIEVRNVSYQYEKNQLGLQKINLKMRRGERLGIVGANGSGKSTFFKCLSGILTPKEGEILYQGKPFNVKELRKKVGFVFQEADYQIIGSTVNQEVCFGLMNQGFSPKIIKERSEYALRFMGLTDLRDRLTFQLSGGEKKRLTIADMIAMEYELLLLDEPTIALDEPHLQLFVKSLEDLENEGKTICISSHDMDFLYEWADRLIVFSKGKVLGSGSPSEIFSNSEMIKKAQIATPKIIQIYQAYFKEDEQKHYPLPKNVQELISMMNSQKGERENDEKN